MSLFFFLTFKTCMWHKPVWSWWNLTSAFTILSITTLMESVFTHFTTPSNQLASHLCRNACSMVISRLLYVFSAARFWEVKHNCMDLETVKSKFNYRVYVCFVLTHSHLSQRGPHLGPHPTVFRRLRVRWRLVIKSFLQPVSSYRRFKEGSCELLTKGCALSTG